MRQTFFAVVLTIFVNCVGFGQEFVIDQAPGAEELVKLLVSINKPTNPKREPWIGFPKSYDHKAQKTIEQASDQLFKLGFSAIPELLEHLDDNRYCRTWSYSLLVDTTVGDECFRLIDKITNPNVTPTFDALPRSQFKRIKGYPMRRGTDGEWDHISLSYFDLLRHRDRTLTRGSVATWWNSFSDKSIDHIHLAAVQRLIAHEEALGFHVDSNKEQYLEPYRNLQQRLRSRLDPK